ncbi:MAG TPA: sugar phosphate isomerase/epimerase, partial [Candidatus Latescibacteria bacterium]|nr:sugar phosphate isomerase/epimerase [Candidatus Latescibacterota bacterium]
MKLSLSGRLFEVDYSYCELTIKEFATLAKNTGYQGVELRKTQVSLETPAQEVIGIRQTVQKAGLEVTCITTRGIFLKDKKSFEFFKRYVSLAKNLDCKLIKTGGDVPWVQRAADYAAEHDIILAGNSHVRTPFETVSSTLKYLRVINRGNYKLIYDPANLFMAQEDYGPEAILKLADYICYVTVQCPKRIPLEEGEGHFQYKGFAYEQGLPGEEGAPDFTSVFRGLHRIGYDGWV